MKHKTVKTVLGVVIGICLFSLLGSVFTQIANFVMYEHLIENRQADTTLLTDIRWISLTVGLLIVPVIVGCVLWLLEKGRAFKITSSAVSLGVFAAAIVFMDVIRKEAEYLSGTGYATGIAYVPELMQIAISCFVLGVISAVAAVLSAKSNTCRCCTTKPNVDGEESKEAQNEEN